MSKKKADDSQPKKEYIFLDKETGEVIDSTSALLSLLKSKPSEELPSKDNGFCKVYFDGLNKIVNRTEEPIIHSKKLQIIVWLIKHMSYKNELKYSYREIEKATGISYQTIADTIKFLEKYDFLCRDEKVLIMNPAIVFKGDFNKKGRVLETYAEAKKKAEFPALDSQDIKKYEEAEKRIEQIEGIVKRLKKEERELKKLRYRFKKQQEKAEDETRKKSPDKEDQTE